MYTGNKIDDFKIDTIKKDVSEYLGKRDTSETHTQRRERKRGGEKGEVRERMYRRIWDFFFSKIRLKEVGTGLRDPLSLSFRSLWSKHQSHSTEKASGSEILEHPRISFSWSLCSKPLALFLLLKKCQLCKGSTCMGGTNSNSVHLNKENITCS